ncbi:MAG: glycosyltransferase family 39 protein [Bradyrhizobiaceae bacterium]|nr:MAG: glycosyltransferase family 39 protein [Bradyrhizobiaceae bacterium]
MQTTLEKLSRRDWRRPLEAWLGGIEAGWAIPAFLAIFIVFWMLQFTITYINVDLHPDVLEAWSVGRFWTWGNPKHPPLMGWLAHLWTEIFPLTDWSIRLLAMVNAAVALWAVDLIVRRFARADRRAMVLLLLMLLPVYQFHAQKFNANSVLLAVWPLATYCFLRSFETRSGFWSVATGVMCAFAMLGKYYSVFLIAGFGFAAIAHPQRASYLRSPAPWISMLAGFVVLGPHIHWLATTGSEPFQYAMRVHSGLPIETSLKDTVEFLLGICGYLALPMFVWLLMAEFNLRAVAQDLRRMNSGLRLLALIFVGSIIFPVVTALVLRTNLPSLWHLQGLFLVVIVAVCSAQFAVERSQVARLMLTVAAVCVIALLAAPVQAVYRTKHPYKQGRNFYSLAAAVLNREWHAAYGIPLARVSGDDGLAFAAGFYGPDHPVYSRPFRFQGQWGIPRDVTLDKGWSALCFADDASCMSWMDTVGDRTEREQRFEFTVQSNLWGMPGASRKVAVIMVSPVKGENPSLPKNSNDERLEDFSSSRRRTHNSFFHRAENDGGSALDRVVRIAKSP